MAEGYELSRDEQQQLVDTEFLIFSPDADAPKRHKVIMHRVPQLSEIKNVVMPFLAPHAENMEHVAVLFEGKPHDMFVDDMGALDTVARPQLPMNREATQIYHTFAIKSGMDMKDAAMIHGVAVLCLRRIWF